MTNLNKKTEFIELNRTFRELLHEERKNDEVGMREVFYSGESLAWPDLLKEYRLIILSEAGSGKTAEIRNIALKLKKQNKQSFFLRLEHIPGNFEDAFEVGTYETFLEWRDSEKDGWIFLDSVDEARLRDPRDFELAIKKLSREVQTAYKRVHIVITGRITAWRPKTDLALCNTNLPHVGTTSEHVQQSDNGGEIDDGFMFESEIQRSDQLISKSVAHEDPNSDQISKSFFKIMALEDLISNQINKFVKAQGVTENLAFLDAVERADALSFTSRPQDLEELIELWIDEGRIGTRLEIMRNSIKRRLAERDQNHAEAHPITADRATQGARLLAAATILTQDPTIRIPDGAYNSTGIAVQFIIDDWDDKEQATLLSRPIFDEAIYGTVRFHHRSVQEYLAAEWLADLLKRETSRRDIERLFFRNQYGLDVVVPALRPILPWLVILDEKIRKRVYTLAPEIFFEGGDPSQLPLDLRRRILCDFCREIAAGTKGLSLHDYQSVQRFANPDLTADVCDLIRKFSNHDDLTEFLLSMVWVGQLEGARSEVLKVALERTTTKHVRVTAFMAIKAIGSDEDLKHVRQNFLTETSKLRRELLDELVKGVIPSEETLSWLLACLEKSMPIERYSVDSLMDSVTEFIGSADTVLLPKLITGFNNLLNLSPMIESQHWEVSEKFHWLLEPASKAVEKLIISHNSATLEPDTLGILDKLQIASDYQSDVVAENEVYLFKLVPEWKELNRALFWFSVDRERKRIEKEGDKRLTNFWEASLFGSFWRFEVDDFEYVAEEISRQECIDDKLVALSLAFHLYTEAQQPITWCDQLKKLITTNDELSTRLENYLSPPAQSTESRRLKQQQANWKKRGETQRKKQEDDRIARKKWFNEELENLREKRCKNPGVNTQPMYHLLNQILRNNRSSERGNENAWKTLIPEYGEDVARFYRDSASSFWRHHVPKLRSEGAPFNKTTYDVLIGLHGLEIEADNEKDWIRYLRPAEVELACRYASFELNGFPTWFPKLFESHPEIVCKFIMQEIRYELSIEKLETNTHYVLSDVRWSGQWAWDKLASSINDQLKREPQNLTNLDSLLKIVAASNLCGKWIEKLASRKCHTLGKLDHLARWFAVWTGVSPEAAIASLKKQIAEMDDPQDQTILAMNFVTYLSGGRWGEVVAVRQEFKTPEHLKSLYTLMHKYIRRNEDIHHDDGRVYTPGLREEAQNARDNLVNLLKEIPGKESFTALNELAKVHPEEDSRHWMRHYAKTRAEQDSDIGPWSLEQVKDFNEKIERTPSNHRELAELAELRLLDLKDDLEHGDSSIADILQQITHETGMRKFIGRELREKAFGRYSIPQEEELADAKSPDLRLHGMGFDGPVPVELKLADNWSGPKLFERLENQLCGDYLQDDRSNRGIYLLVYLGDKTSWDLPDGNRVDFSELIVALEKHWQHISPVFPEVDDITVIGIDLTIRSGA